jgi:ribosomal protein S18 acetylase RimI-like enzyme
MTQMRRLEAPKKDDLFETARTSPLRSFDIEREDFERLGRERPELIAATDTGLMLVAAKGSRAWLCYGFDSIESFRRDFQPALQVLVDGLAADEAPSGLFLRFTDLPNRPYVEPVLAASFFELRYEWIEMKLLDLPGGPAPSDEVVPGFVLRPVALDEYDAFAAVDAAAFAQDPWLPADFVEAVTRASQMRALEERESGRLVGYVILHLEAGHVGKVSVVAVHPDFQRRGLGEAMLRWSLAWFREEAMRRAKLNVRVDNPTAIALYRKLGFVSGRSGLVYRRPTARDELDAMASKRKGTYIKFGGWR